jgi:hypothetical protein
MNSAWIHRKHPKTEGARRGGGGGVGGGKKNNDSNNKRDFLNWKVKAASYHLAWGWRCAKLWWMRSAQWPRSRDGCRSLRRLECRRRWAGAFGISDLGTASLQEKKRVPLRAALRAALRSRRRRATRRALPKLPACWTFPSACGCRTSLWRWELVNGDGTNNRLTFWSPPPVAGSRSTGCRGRAAPRTWLRAASPAPWLPRPGPNPLRHWACPVWQWARTLPIALGFNCSCGDQQGSREQLGQETWGIHPQATALALVMVEFEEVIWSWGVYFYYNQNHICLSQGFPICAMGKHNHKRSDSELSFGPQSAWS